MNKIILVSVFTAVLILSACSSSDDAAQIIADLEVTVSGKITDINDAPLSDVVIEGVYAKPDGLLDPRDTSNADGSFALLVIKGESFYLRATKSTFATINSARTTLNANEANLEIGIPTEIEAQGVIDTAYGAGTALASRAWLVVDVFDANGDEVNNQTISVLATADKEVYTNCDGFDSGAIATNGAPCLTDRNGPMYIASFTTTGETFVTVGAEIQTVPLRMGEITIIEFEQ